MDLNQGVSATPDSSDKRRKYKNSISDNPCLWLFTEEELVYYLKKHKENKE